MAKKLDPGAELSGIDIEDPIQRGLVDLSKNQSIVFSFDYREKTSLGDISVDVTQNSLQATRVPHIGVGERLADPKCKVGEAWKAATRAGVSPESSATFRYGDGGRGTWLLEVPGRPELRREIDGQTCAVVPAKP